VLDGFADRVVAWQLEHGRHTLPWQGTRDPYRVWLSEIMLQQTQVTTVLAYYTRFLERFPDVASLAAASEDDVLAAWSGLGYYRRARLLHRCAREVVDRHGGAFPPTRDALATLPGIGRSTAGAIAAFCFGERVAILDGNVKRVLTRVLAFSEDLQRTAAQQRLWAAAEALLPNRGIQAYTQGLMDLGATVCLARHPSCPSCPVRASCAAHAAGQPERYPVKSRRSERGRRRSVWLWLEHRGHVLLVQRSAQGVWPALWSLPEFDDFEALAAASAGWPGEGTAMPDVEHALTHFDWLLQPRRWRLTDEADAAAHALPLVDAGGVVHRWVTPIRALELALPTPWRRLMREAAASATTR
jgi:A/G-specific adenine glycosylase